MPDADRELLALAAKAAGYPIHSDAWACGPGGVKPQLYMGNRGPVWNPLDDDGDALRLAVKLQLTVCNEHLEAGVAYCTDAMDRSYPEVRPLVDTGKAITDQDFSATRRAIVRAAAEIGRSTP